MDASKRLLAVFFRNAASAPVREWLLELSREDRKIIGSDIKTVEFGWPIGMPTCRPMSGGLYEVRSHLANRSARVLCCISDGQLVLLHGFIKKDQQTPEADLRLARERMQLVLRQPKSIANTRR